MIEPIMFVGIGVFITGLLVLGIIPLVHARAVRLTMRRLEALTPLSMAEIQADKDQLRAEFAMSTRRLEMSVEQMKAKTINQLADIGKKSEAIGRLKLELGEKTAALFALEAKERQLTEDLQGMEFELTSKSEALEEAQRALAQTQVELEQVSSSFHESSTATDDQRVELVALRAQTEALKGQVESYEQESRDLLARLAAKTGEVEVLSQQLADERARSDQLGTRLDELDRQIIVRTTDSEVLERRFQELTVRFDQQGRFLAERERVCDQLGTRLGELDRQIIVRTTDSEVLERRFQELTVRFDQQSRFLAEREHVSDRLVADLETARRTEAEVRHALADAEDRHRFATETVRAEKALVEEELRQMREERTRLQREIASLKRDAENAWANERMENAILRERINDVAAEVARLTATLEGPGSRIDSLLGSADRRAGRRPTEAMGPPRSLPAAASSKGTLADRIRALQSRASRASQPSGA